MKLCHTVKATSSRFDDPNLIGTTGLVPVMALAERAGLDQLAAEWVHVPTDKGANPGGKITSLVAGMVAGADSIDDIDLLRHGGMAKVFGGIYAPSTAGSFLRKFSFGHVRQLDAVASRFLINLNQETPLIPVTDDGWVMVDVDDTVDQVYGHKKQGAGFGYNKVRGLNALIATASTTSSAPVIVAQRLRKGACASARGAARLVADAVTDTRRLIPEGSRVLLRADSAYYRRPTVWAALKAGAHVSVTIRSSPRVTTAITSIPEEAWTPIKYPRALYDEATKTWISEAEVAETAYTAFISAPRRQRVTGRLVVRRVQAINPEPAQYPLFPTWRYHGFFTTVPRDELDTVATDQVHRAHAIIEQVHADLKNSALAHMPSGVFNANAAWLILAIIAFNLTRTAAIIAGLATATTGTIRRHLVNIPARIATSARRIILHLPRLCFVLCEVPRYVKLDVVRACQNWFSSALCIVTMFASWWLMMG